ncbi:MAG: phenylalanine--tRNA ligase subunit beta, partial [Zetaproteobacteria bacterium]
AIVLESAYFAGGTVSLARRRLGLATEAALRFERGVDPQLVTYALWRAAHWIVELFGGRITAYGAAGNLAPLAAFRHVHGALSDIEERLGFAVPPHADEVLARMGFRVERRGGFVHVEVPPYRPDVRAWWDLAEEYGRIVGLEEVPAVMPKLALRPKRRLEDDPTQAARGIGFVELVSLAFSSPKRERLFAPDAEHDVVLANPLSEDATILRRSLAPSLLQAASKNLRRGVRSVRLVEHGKVYRWQGEGPVEEARLGWCVAGLAQDDEWWGKARAFDFFDLKGAVAHWCAARGLAVDWVADDEIPGLEPGQAARIVLGRQRIGIIGQASEEALALFDLKQPAFVAEIELDRLPEGRTRRFAPAPEHPSIVRDLVFWVPKGMRASELVRLVREGAGKLCVAARVFDRFVEPATGRVSLGVRLVLRAPDRTLEQEEADAAIAQAVEAAEREGAIWRGREGA